MQNKPESSYSDASTAAFIVIMALVNVLNEESIKTVLFIIRGAIKHNSDKPGIVSVLNDYEKAISKFVS